MALRLAALGRQACLGGGLSDLFDGAGNAINIVVRNGALPADPDSVAAGTVIAQLAGQDGSYNAPTDDNTTATAALAANVGPANATAAHNLNSANDGEAVGEIYQGSTIQAASKVGDFTVGGANTTGTQDLDFDGDDIQIGTQLTITQFDLTQV